MTPPSQGVILVAVLSYFFGSIPTGYLIARLNGIDIRKHGSGNIGATNVLRIVGRKWGYLVFFLDVVKGWVSVQLAFEIVACRPGSAWIGDLPILAAVICILGHTFPIWLRFKGGKGVATSAGVLLALMPLEIFLIFLVWLFLFQLTHYVSVASVGAALALPITVAILVRRDISQGHTLLYFSIVISAVVIWRHRSNLQRLAAGTECRFTRK
jgi:glycerol-3-phosphate acyltransferase PlsY